MQWMTSDWMVFPWIQFDVRDANSRQVSCVEFENQNDWNDGIEFFIVSFSIEASLCIYMWRYYRAQNIHTTNMEHGEFCVCTPDDIQDILFVYVRMNEMLCAMHFIHSNQKRNEYLELRRRLHASTRRKKIWMWILNGACTHSWEIKDSFWLNEWQSFTVRRRLHFPHSKTRKLVASRKLLPHNCRRSEERHDTNEWTANINKQSWWRWHWCENEYFDNIRQLSEELRSDVSLWVFHIEQTSSTELEKKCWRKKITNVVCERRKSIIVAAFASKTLFFFVRSVVSLFKCALLEHSVRLDDV